MIESDARKIRHAGKAATLTVIRNDGFCWGRIRIDETGEQLDVNTKRDQYERCDEDALDAFEQAAKMPRNVSAAQGWLGT